MTMAEQEIPRDWRQVVGAVQELPDYRSAPPQLRARVLRLLARKVVRSGAFGGSAEASRAFTRDVVVPEAYRREGQDRANAEALDRAQEVDAPLLPDVRLRRGFEAAARALDRAGLSLSNDAGTDFVEAQRNTPTGMVARRLSGERVDLPTPSDALGAFAAQGRDALDAGREIAGDLAAGRTAGMGSGLVGAAATTAGSLADPLGLALGVGAGRAVGVAAGRAAADVARLGGRVGARAAQRIERGAPVAGAAAGGAAVGAVPPLVAGRAPTAGEVGLGALLGAAGQAPASPRPRPAPIPTAATAPIRARVLPRAEGGDLPSQRVAGLLDEPGPAQGPDAPELLGPSPTPAPSGGPSPSLAEALAQARRRAAAGPAPTQEPTGPRPPVGIDPSELPPLVPPEGLGLGSRLAAADVPPPEAPAQAPGLAGAEAARVIAQRPGDPPIRSAMVDLPSLELDPQTFQFKEGGDGQGVTERLRGVEAWDPGAAAANRVIVFERADGRRVVADGHQRTGLARRIREQGGEVPPSEALVLREADGWSPPKVLAFAARNNLQQGTGGPLDVARLLRAGTLGDADRAVMPKAGQAGAAWRDGEALARLETEPFDLVAAGLVEPEHAAAVARHIDGGPQQVAALRQMAKRPPGTKAEAEATARMISALGFGERVEQTLFGPQLKADPLIDWGGPIITEAAKLLRGDRSFYTRLATAKGKAQKVKGNRINEEGTAKAAAEAADVAALSDLVMMAPGNVRQRMRALASQVGAGQMTKAQAGRALAEAVGQQVEILRGKGLDRAKAVRLFAERGELPPDMQVPLAPELLEVVEAQGPVLDGLASRLASTLDEGDLAALADHLEQEGMAVIAEGQGSLFSGVDPRMLAGAVQVTAAHLLRGSLSGAGALAAIGARFGALGRRAVVVAAEVLRRLLSDEAGLFDTRRLNDFIEAAFDRAGELVGDAAALGAEAFRRAAAPFARGSRADDTLGAIRQAQQRGEAYAARAFGTIFNTMSDFAQERLGATVRPSDIQRMVLAAHAIYKTGRPNEEALARALASRGIPPAYTRAGLAALEAWRHAFISNYGVPPSVIEAAMQAQNWAKGRTNFVRRTAADLAQLPLEERNRLGVEVTEGVPGSRSQEAEHIANVATQVSREMREVGALTPEQVAKWAGNYLPRVYQKRLLPAVAEAIVSAAKAMKGSKSRGFKQKMSARAFNEAKQAGELWEFRGYVGAYGAKALAQEAKTAKLRDALDKAIEARDAAKVAKLQERFEAEATKLADMWDDPALEVNAWRDYTFDERAEMGELQDVALRLKVLADQSERDLRNGRLLSDIAQMGDDEGPFVLGLDEDGALLEPADPEAWVLMGLEKAGAVKKWGPLAGRYVRADVARYLRWRFEWLPFIQKAKTWLGVNRFKAFKTIWNPSYFINNAGVNVPTLELAGGSMFDVPRAIQEMTAQTPLVQALEAQGIIRSGILQRDLAETLTAQYAPLLGEADAEQFEGSLARAARALKAFEGKLGDLSQAEDDAFKVALVIGKVREGMPLGQAARVAQDAFYDATRVTAPAAEVLSVLVPFAKVAWYTLDRYPVLVAQNPAKATALLAYVTAAYSLFSAAAGVGSPEEARGRDKLMPKGLNRGIIPGATYLPLPVRDSYGQELILSTRNMNPLNTFEVAENTALPAWPQALMPGGPPMTAAQLLLNRDQFSGREITNPDDPPLQRTIDALGYTARALGPSAITDKGANVLLAATGQTDRYGRRMDLPTAGANLLGLKVQPVDLMRQRDREASGYQRRMREARADERAAQRSAARAPDWAGLWASDAAKARARFERAAREFDEFMRATAPAVAPGTRANPTPATQALPQGGTP